MSEGSAYRVLIRGVDLIVAGYTGGKLWKKKQNAQIEADESEHTNSSAASAVDARRSDDDESTALTDNDVTTACDPSDREMTHLSGQPARK